MVDYPVPLVGGDVGEVFTVDVLGDESVDYSGIEVIACPYGAYCLNLRYGEGQGGMAGEEPYFLSSVGADHVLTVRTYVLGIDVLGRCAAGKRTEYVVEIFRGASYYVGISYILHYVGIELADFVGVGLAEVEVIVYDGSSLVCQGDEFPGLLPENGIEDEVGAHHDYVVLADFGPYDVEACLGIVLEELVFGIVVLVEPCKGDRCTAVFVDTYVGVVDSVLAEEVHYDVAWTVVSRLADEGGVHSESS